MPMTTSASAAASDSSTFESAAGSGAALRATAPVKSSGAPSPDPNRWRNCHSWLTQTIEFRYQDENRVEHKQFISDVQGLAAAEKGASWSDGICARYTPRDCIAYSYLADCGGRDIVLRWYNDGTPLDNDVPRWLCEQGYASPLYQKFYPVRGVCPTYGPDPWPAGKVRPQLEAVMIAYNGREPIYWPVSWKGCEPGLECTFAFFFPCEPLWDPPHIVDGGWIWKVEPGRIRPSGGGAE